MTFASTADLVAYLRLPAGYDEDLIEIALEGASDVVRGYCQQTLDLVEDEEITLDGDATDGGALLLPELPVVEVTDVSTYTEDDLSDELVLVEDTDFRVGDAGILYRLDRETWPLGRKNITVTYSHGYATIPWRIRLITLQVAARIFAVGQAQRETIGSYSVDYVTAAGGLTADEKAVLQKFRHTRVP